MPSRFTFIWASAIVHSILAALALAEPVQYCRFGHSHGEADFCLGVTTHLNHSTNAHDVYLSFTVTRSSHLGWTAIGTGPKMDGSLMFIVYGDPESDDAPTISIRQATGHYQPHRVDLQDNSYPSFRVLMADWAAAASDEDVAFPKGKHPKTYVAQIGVVCYACSRWTGSPITATTASQPWIWAWNSKQDDLGTNLDARLSMHAYGSAFGVFYVDMAGAQTNNPAQLTIPALRPGVAMHGTSDDPIDAKQATAFVRAQPLASAHGMLMGTAFMLLFPLGAVAMRSGWAAAFKYHGWIQLVASVMVWTGVVIGLIMSRGGQFDTPHQAAGLVLAVVLVLQGVLGWKHHLDYLRIRRRTWISHVHIWIGRAAVLGGWGNILAGLALAGHGRAGKVMAGLMMLKLVGGSIWMWAVKSRTGRTADARARARNAEAAKWSDDSGKYFSVGHSEDGDDDDDDDVGGEGAGEYLMGNKGSESRESIVVVEEK